MPLGRASFKVRLGLVMNRNMRQCLVRHHTGNRIIPLSRRVFCDRRCWRRYTPGSSGTFSKGAVFFFDLQVGKTSNSLGCQSGVRRLLQKALITQHRFLKPAFDLLFLDLDLHMTQFANGILVAG